MTAEPQAVLGPVLAKAIADLRLQLGDPTAAIAIVTPSNVNGTLVRRELAFATNYVRVETWTPAEIEGVLAEAGLRRAGEVVEPPGWLRSSIVGIVRDEALPGGYHEVLREAGWAGALASAIASLEGGRVSAELLETLSLGPGLAERTQALGQLLRRVGERRAAENVAGAATVADAALAAIRAGEASPVSMSRGVILLGDARLPRTTFEVLAAWLAPRAVVRIAPHELSTLAADSHGLSFAAPHATVVPLPPRAPKVELVRTPDPTREMREAVRQAQAAVGRGVPLDRIAIVLPDPAEATALADALAHAELPATWLTGRPLVETPAARFVLHALDVALGHDTALCWYDLLRRPELRLRGVLGEPGVAGRGRWRRLLASTRVARGTAKIVHELARLRAEPGREGETDEARDARFASIDGLVLALETLEATLRALAESARSVGLHARALAALVRAWWAPTPDQAVVARLLEQWGRSLRGPAISLAEMTATLRETLESTETLSGSLKDPALRVLSPMQLLGAELDLVLVTGVTEGRFPRRPAEDPVLADALLDAIETQTAAGLLRSSDRVLLERRRLAAIRSAARGTLWLSAPLVEMLEGRPLQPGSVLLDFVSELEGKRVLPSELARAMQPCGRRSRTWPVDPTCALGPLEHLLARLFGDDATRRATVEAVVDHTLARRIVVAERARDRIARGEIEAVLARHAGFVDPTVAPCKGLDGTALTAGELAELLKQPEHFFLLHVVNAWPPRRLKDGWDPVSSWFVDQTVLRESRAVLESADRIAERLRAAFDAKAAEEVLRAGDPDAEALARLGRMAERAIDGLVRAGPSAGVIVSIDDRAIAADLPWRLRDGDARRIGSGLEWAVAEVPGPRSLHNAVAELLEAAARRTTSKVDAVRFVDLRGGVREDDDPGAHIDGAVESVRLAQPAIAAGYFPVRADPEAFVLWRTVLAGGKT